MGIPLVSGDRREPGPMHVVPAVPAHFRTECRGSLCVLHVSGDVDMSNSRVLDAEITRAAASHTGGLVVSFVGCTFADSTCLSVLTRQYATLQERLLILAPHGGRLRRLLDLAFLTAMLPVCAWPAIGEPATGKRAGRVASGSSGVSIFRAQPSDT